MPAELTTDLFLKKQTKNDLIFLLFEFVWIFKDLNAFKSKQTHTYSLMLRPQDCR